MILVMSGAPAVHGQELVQKRRRAFASFCRCAMFGEMAAAKTSGARGIIPVLELQ